jgi:hypothetical protein
MGITTRADLDRLGLEVRRSHSDLSHRLDVLTRRANRSEQHADAAAEQLAALGATAGIQSLGRWIAHVELRTQPLVSVVLPTRHRPHQLRRAISSVLAQRYANWELLVVQDGDDTDARVIVTATEDPRVRWLAISSGGVCAARNEALRLARGEIIAYLDDDNVMDPGWLHAVTWAFEQRPDADVLYGAFVIDDVLRVTGDGSGAMPQTFLHEWSREALRRDNLADMGAIAHRAGLPGAWFDEGLREMGDWDLLLRLTAETDPVVLPAVACYYTTDAPARLSGGPTNAADRATVLTRAAGPGS